MFKPTKQSGDAKKIFKDLEKEKKKSASDNKKRKDKLASTDLFQIPGDRASY